MFRAGFEEGFEDVAVAAVFGFGLADWGVALEDCDAEGGVHGRFEGGRWIQATTNR